MSDASGDFNEADKLVALIRPESIVITSIDESDVTRGIVAFKSFLGPLTKVGVSLEGFPVININLQSKDAKNIEIGQKIGFKIVATDVMVQRA